MRLAVPSSYICYPLSMMEHFCYFHHDRVLRDLFRICPRPSTTKAVFRPASYEESTGAAWLAFIGLGSVKLDDEVICYVAEISKYDFRLAPLAVSS